MEEKYDHKKVKDIVVKRATDNPHVTKESVDKVAKEVGDLYAYFLEHGELPPKEQEQDLDK